MQSNAPRWWVRAYRIVTVVAVCAAIFWQARSLQDRPAGFQPGNFFSFFTIQSNIFAAIVLLFGATRSQRDWSSPRLDLVRGAAALYMAITGVVYGVLLSGYQEELQTTLPWVDTVLHKLVPLVMVADWLIDPPVSKITFKRALVWLAYPAVYLVYTLIRGPIVDWYPYPFLDPDHGSGYGEVAIYAVGIAIFAAGMTWVMVWLGTKARSVHRAMEDSVTVRASA